MSEQHPKIVRAVQARAGTATVRFERRELDPFRVEAGAEHDEESGTVRLTGVTVVDDGPRKDHPGVKPGVYLGGRVRVELETDRSGWIRVWYIPVYVKNPYVEGFKPEATPCTLDPHLRAVLEQIKRNIREEELVERAARLAEKHGEGPMDETTKALVDALLLRLREGEKR